MIEAVNSVVANALSVRVAADAVSTARSFTANPARVQEAAAPPPDSPQAPYLDRIAVNYDYDRAVIEVRDSVSGDVEGQLPSESVLEAQSRATYAAELRTAREAPVIQRQDNVSRSDIETKASVSGVKPIDVVSVQEFVGANTPSNVPQAAVAALSAGAKTSQSAPDHGVSVFA